MNDDAARNEVTQPDTITIEFEGHEYQVPATFEDVDIDVARAAERGHAVTMIEGVFGDQFATLERRYRANHGGRFPAKDLEPLAEKIAAAYGFASAGE